MGTTDQVDGAGLEAEADELLPGAAPTDDLDRPITMREYMAGIGGLRQEVGRSMQSQLDKADHRITDRLRSELASQDRLVKELEGLGIQVPPEIRERLRQGKVVETLTAAGVEPGGPTGRGNAPAPRQEPVGQVNPVQAATEAAWTIMTEEFGVVVQEGDPEFEMLDLKTNRPSVFLKSVERAAATKAARLGGQGNGGAEGVRGGPAPVGRPKARIPLRSNQPAPKNFEGMTGYDLLKLGYAKTTKE